MFFHGWSKARANHRWHGACAVVVHRRLSSCHLVLLCHRAATSSHHHTRRMQQRTDRSSTPFQGIKGAHIHDTAPNLSFFPSPTISAFSPLPSLRPRCPLTTNSAPLCSPFSSSVLISFSFPVYTPISTRPLAAHSWYVPCYLLLFISPAIQAKDVPAPIVTGIISSKAPPLPKEVAEDLLYENKNRLVRTVINASRAI